MEKGYRRTRIIALLSAIVFASSIVLSGCSVKKITKKDVEKTTDDDVVQIGEGTDEIAEDEEIVVGDDGQTYVSDSNGTTRLYTGGSSSNKTTKAQTPTQGNNYTPPATTRKPYTSPSTKASTKAPDLKEEVYNKLAVQRRFGFNKAYDKLAGIGNFFLDSITAYFEYDDKYWLIEFWKGEYAIGAVGCEIGFYTADPKKWSYVYNNEKMGPEYVMYASVDDNNAMKVSMKMWQYQTPDQTTPVQKIDYNIGQPHWWAADFATGRLYKNSDRTTLVMVGSIQFPNKTMKNLFVEAMEEKGFKEGTINTYHNVETYQVDGYKVTVCWRNYSDGYQVGK